MIDTLYFETYSITHVIKNLKGVLRARYIYFHSVIDYPIDLTKVKKRIVHAVIKAINPGVNIQVVPQEIVAKHLWRLNRQSLPLIDKMENDITMSGFYRLIMDVIGDDHAVNYYKMELARYLPNSLLFWSLTAELADRHGGLIVIPDTCDIPGVESFYREFHEEKSISIADMGGLDRVRCCLMRLFNALAICALPMVVVLTKIRRVRFRPIDRAYFPVRAPVVWGLRHGNSRVHGVKRPHDDGFLYDNNIRPGDMVHIFGQWGLSPRLKNGYKKIMTERGYAWRDRDDFLMDLKCLKGFMDLGRKIVLSSIKERLFLKETIPLGAITLRFLYQYMLKTLELENIRYSVEFVRNDYSPEHIIATILLNRIGSKTIGMQHVHIPQTSPQLAYIHLNRYIVFGEMFVNAYSPYWNGIKLKKIGSYSLDWVRGLMRDKERLGHIRKRYEGLYPNRSKIIVIILPSGRKLNLKSRWEELFSALMEFQDTDMDCSVFLRFRKEEDLSVYKHLRRFRDLPKLDDRIYIDHKNFTTYEFMALADVVITSSASFAINESAITGAKVFTLDMTNFTKYYFPDYGRDFILRSKGDLLRVFAGMKKDFAGFDCKWDKLRTECNYHADGHNMQRIRDCVFSAVAGKNGKKYVEETEKEAVSV